MDSVCFPETIFRLSQNGPGMTFRVSGRPTRLRSTGSLSSTLKRGRVRFAPVFLMPQPDNGCADAAVSHLARKVCQNASIFSCGSESGNFAPFGASAYVVSRKTILTLA